MLKLHNIGEMMAAVLNGTKRPSNMTHDQARVSEVHRKRVLSILVDLSTEVKISQSHAKQYKY